MSKYEMAFQRLDAAIEKIRNSEYIQIVYANGTQVTGRMMSTFDCEPMHQVYMIFTDDTKTQEGLYNAYAAKFHTLLGYGPEGDEEEMKLELVDGQNHEEVDMIDGVIKKVLSKGAFIRKPICKLRFGGIQKVYFR
jgi:uncharacterized protein YrzB (UPF0473 family)